PKQTAPYRIARRLRLESLYPVLQGYKETGAAGMRVNFSDPLQLNRASLTAAVSGGAGAPPAPPAPPGPRQPDATGGDAPRGRAECNRGVFAALSGPTKTSRKGYLFGAGHRSTLIFDEPRRLDLDIDASYSGNLDRLPEYQTVAVDVRRLGTVEARLRFSDVRNSLGYVDEETGRKWSIGGRSDIVHGLVVPKLYGTFDRGWALPAGHSSLWVRSSGGLSPTSVTEPFANFYFGGFGNNWVDHKDEKRYREYFSFPGAEIN